MWKRVSASGADPGFEKGGPHPLLMDHHCTNPMVTSPGSMESYDTITIATIALAVLSIGNARAEWSVSCLRQVVHACMYSSGFEQPLGIVALQFHGCDKFMQTHLLASSIVLWISLKLRGDDMSPTSPPLDQPLCMAPTEGGREGGRNNKFHYSCEFYIGPSS